MDKKTVRGLIIMLGVLITGCQSSPINRKLLQSAPIMAQPDQPPIPGIISPKMKAMTSMAQPMTIIQSPPAVILLPSATKLEWEASPDADRVVGYNVYYGPASHDYLQQVNVGNALEAIINDLTIGQTYFIAVTCYDFEGCESDFSDELIYLVPQRLGLILDPLGNALESSPDFINWSPRQATLKSDMWVITIPPDSTREFFRSVVAQ